MTLVKLIDVNGYGKVFWTIDQPQGQSVGTWSQHAGKGTSPFNKVSSPPRKLYNFAGIQLLTKKFMKLH
ncbi:hypothetical protein [Cedecea colo]|uniref:hypothetical protein n=1 Tax=Cedecea colo TaxID=2552946 RepID=UPI0030846A3A